MKDFIKNFLPWLITAGVLLFIFLVPKRQGADVDSIKTDTIYKTIVIPEKNRDIQYLTTYTYLYLDRKSVV